MLFLSSSAGLGTGMAIVAATLLLRLMLLPISWSSSYQSCIRQKRVRELAPKLKILKERFGGQPDRLLEETMKLYRRRGIEFVDFKPVLTSIIQLPVLFGMFSVLKQGLSQSRFLWIENLSRPDFLLSVIAGVSTAMIMLANPDLPEQTRMLLILLPAALAFIFALKFSSALALYWVASNGFTTLQTALLHRLVKRRIDSGAIRL